MSDLRAEIERLAREWEREAGRRRKDAARSGEPPSSRRMLECGAAFELSHAAALRAALRSTGSPEPEGGGRATFTTPSPWKCPAGTYLCPGTGETRDGLCMHCGLPVPAPEEAATGTREDRHD